jgi:translation initiation factor IF-1
MSKEDLIKQDGVVVEVNANARFKVQLESGVVIDATIAGKMRLHYIRILAGDKVTVEMSPYDLTKGRIVYRHK